MADLVIPNPEFKRYQLSAEDAFMILASDGLWDVMTGQDAVEEIQRLLASGKTARGCAEELCRLALKLGSSDNVTIIVVIFDYNA